MGNFVSIKGFSSVSITPSITPPTLATLSGQSQKDSIAQSMRTMILDRRSGQVLRHFWTIASGNYSVFVDPSYVGVNNLMSISFDDDGVFNAGIIDHMVATAY